jgi:(R)-amidase
MNIVINQIEISDYAPEENTRKILSHLTAQTEVRGFILFPELCLTGFPTAQNLGELWQASEAGFARIVEFSRHLAATIVLGHIEQCDGRFYNSCFYLRNGEILHSHRKRRLWIDDIGIFSAGTADRTCLIEDTRCGSQICFDLEFPEGSRALAKQGAELILMPNGNMKPYGNTHFILSQARAIENQCFVVTCNRVGSGHGGDFVGESLLVSPTGRILTHLGDKEEIAQVCIDINEVQESRKTYTYIEQL